MKKAFSLLQTVLFVAFGLSSNGTRAKMVEIPLRRKDPINELPSPNQKSRLYTKTPHPHAMVAAEPSTTPEVYASDYLAYDMGNYKNAQYYGTLFVGSDG